MCNEVIDTKYNSEMGLEKFNLNCEDLLNWIGFMFMLTFSVNFNVNIVGVQPFIQCKIAGGFYSPHRATFYVPPSDLFLNIERLQLKYLEVIWQRATSYLFSWHYQQFYK